MTQPSAKTVDREEAVHLSLQLGRLLLTSGADTTQVQMAVERFAAGMGCEARLVVTYEALLLTVISGDEFRTKVGLPVVGMTVNMTAAAVLNEIADDVALGRIDPATARERLAAVEQGGPAYPYWLVASAMGLAAASLSVLFGGALSTFVTVFVAATLEILVQQRLRHRRVHPLGVTFVTALAGGSIGGLGARLYPVVAPALCLVAPAMILVPGVPLTNSIRDAINNNMSLSLARLAAALLTVAAIAFGLVTATALTGFEIPVAASTPLLSIPQDMLFSALATVGFVFLFNVPIRVAWACIICGLCGHGLRTAMMHLGFDVVGGTFLGSLVAGILAYVFARRFKAPPATFAFPGVVAMVPGSYAFRAIIAGLEIMQSADASPVSLVAQAMSLVVSTVLLTAAIAIGLAIPLSLPLTRSPES